MTEDQIQRLADLVVDVEFLIAELTAPELEALSCVFEHVAGATRYQRTALELDSGDHAALARWKLRCAQQVVKELTNSES